MSVKKEAKRQFILAWSYGIMAIVLAASGIWCVIKFDLPEAFIGTALIYSAKPVLELGNAHLTRAARLLNIPD